MISSSNSLPIVIRDICGHDSSIKYNTLLFVGYVRDLYTGKNQIVTDFVEVLNLLSDYISTKSLTYNHLSLIKLKGNDSFGRQQVQSELIKCLYIESQDINTAKLESIIESVYKKGDSTHINNYKKDQKSYIDNFSISSIAPIEYGKIIILTWKCHNPYKLYLYNGLDYMDVTSIDSIQVSALCDKYTLILYDNKDNIIDKKEINVSIRKDAYCINCGWLIYETNDKYCCHCGCKLDYGTIG